MAKAEKKYKARVANRVLYPAIGVIVWTVFSFALIESRARTSATRRAIRHWVGIWW